MVIDITKLEAKLKEQFTQAKERYQINFIPKFWQEREYEMLDMVGSNSGMILSDWTIANGAISKRETYVVTNPLVWPQLL